MIWESFFLFLYPVVPVVGLAGYVPQLIKLYRVKRIPHSISLSTWAVWLMTYFISTGYAALYLKDPLFATTCAMNVVAHMAVIGLTMFKKYKYGRVLEPVVETSPLTVN